MQTLYGASYTEFAYSLYGEILVSCSRKGIQRVKNWVEGCWHGYLSGARCRFPYGPTDPTATHCLLLQEIQIGFGFTFLVPAHPGSPGQNPESHNTHNRFTAGLEYVQVHPGQQVPER